MDKKPIIWLDTETLGDPTAPQIFTGDSHVGVVDDIPNDPDVISTEWPVTTKTAFEEVADAVQVANAAPPVEAVNPITGEPVKHVRVTLSAAQTNAVMSAPPAARAALAEAILAQRAALAEAILAQRALAKDAARVLERMTAKLRAKRKAARRRINKAKRRNR